MTNPNRAVRGFRPGSTITQKTPHHALQKHDSLTRYGHSETQTASSSGWIGHLLWLPLLGLPRISSG